MWVEFALNQRPLQFSSLGMSSVSFEHDLRKTCENGSDAHYSSSCDPLCVNGSDAPYSSSCDPSAVIYAAPLYQPFNSKLDASFVTYAFAAAVQTCIIISRLQTSCCSSIVVCHRLARKLVTSTYQLLPQEEEGLRQRVCQDVLSPLQPAHPRGGAPSALC